MSKRLNIAFYTDSFLPAIDGVVTSTLNFREELMRRGHNVYLFASGNEKTAQFAKREKNVFVLRGVKFSRYPQYNIAFFPFMASLKVRGVDMDIAHAQTPFTVGAYALLTARLNRTPVVGSFHTLFTDKAVIDEYTTSNHMLRKMLLKYSWQYAKFFYNSCNSVIAPSGTIENILRRRSIHNVNVVPNSVDLKRFNPKVDGSKLRRKLLKGRRGKVVTYVGRLSREKKLETLFKAARLLRKKDITFIICGTGPAADYYMSMAARMGLSDSVKFTGFVENRDLPEYYAAGDAFCIPSMFETQGIVSLEAMASGKPVIGADYLALKELISNGRNGEKFKPMDGRDCARKIEKVLYNIDAYKEMYDTAKEYSIEKTTDKLLAVYKSTMNGV